MNIVTIYDHPLDYPNHYVARLFSFEGPTDVLHFSTDLEECRRWAKAMLRHTNGSVPAWFDRDPRDDAFILEVWA